MALSLSGRGHSIDRHGIITNWARAFYTDRLVIDTNWTRPFIDRHGVITNLTRHSSERLGIITNWTRAFYWQTWRYYLECHVGRQNVLLSLIETSELHVVQMDGMIWKSFLYAIRARFNDVVKHCRSNILRYQVYWGLVHQKQISRPGQVITSYNICGIKSLVHALDSCFWHSSPQLSKHIRFNYHFVFKATNPHSITFWIIYNS